MVTRQLGPSTRVVETGPKKPKIGRMEWKPITWVTVNLFRDQKVKDEGHSVSEYTGALYSKL